MIGGKKLLDEVEIVLQDRSDGSTLSLWIDVWQNSLAIRWLAALDWVLEHRLLLQKNYCFLGWADSMRDGVFLCQQINQSIHAINHSGIGYHIDDHFCLEDCLDLDKRLRHQRFNQLHRYFEDLQGVSGAMSTYWNRANNVTRWHISQLNLLCHEFESWALSWRKKHTAPEWQRPSQLMCWNQAPRFLLRQEDHELFGIHTIARPLGAVYVGVNKAVGKHHWEVFQDEGRDSRIDELTTTTLRNQTEAAADFDIEWGKDPAQHPFMHKRLADFRCWLENNGFDPDDPELTIGHPQIGQVDLRRSFGTEDHSEIWNRMKNYLDVISVSTSKNKSTYLYHWSEPDYINLITGGTK